MVRISLGFTLTELVVTMAMSTIVVLTIGIVMADSHRGWSRMYSRVFSDVADAHAARRAFDSVCRKSSREMCLVGNNGEFVEVYYYDDFSSTKPDKYARFYTDQQKLMVEHGDLQEGTWNTLGASSSFELASNVQGVEFSLTGDSVKMVLDLNNGSETMTVTCSAVRRND